MKIGIDTFGCDHGRSGLGSYLLSLVSSLPAADGVEYSLFGPEMDRYTYNSNENCEYKSVSVPDSLTAERWWHYFKVNSFARKQDYDVVLYTAGSRMLPRKFKVPGVAVVNDIVSTLTATHGEDGWFRFNVQKGLMNADCIIAASQYIKRDLEKCGIKDRRIEVIPNGIDHSMFFPDQTLTAGDVVDIKPFAIKRPYIIYASRMQSSEKKHIELIKAFSMFKEKTRLPHRLVIAGSEGPYSEEVHKAAFASSYASDIFITGYFPHENFPELYRGAEACVCPSVNEGVGLAVLEAMATGVPVACSKNGALPEVTGTHALLFDSDNVYEMAESLEKILTDQKLRKDLSDEGLDWVKRFSWEKTARATVELLQDVVSERNK